MKSFKLWSHVIQQFLLDTLAQSYIEALCPFTIIIIIIIVNYNQVRPLRINYLAS